MPNFRTELQNVINQHSKENGSNTPDFILTQYLECCLAAFDQAVQQRDAFHGDVHAATSYVETKPTEKEKENG